MKTLLFQILFVIACLLGSGSALAQEVNWFDPATSSFPVIGGRAWQAGLKSDYDRLPARAKETVRQRLWDLSKNSAGEYIDFKTNAATIIVKYTVSGSLEMPHMPATGVSGVDLYGKGNTGWHWARGRYQFGDTIVYRFSNLALLDLQQEFRLYLPLYNTVTWMSIGTPAGNTFTPLPVSSEKPIVLYGTSIMQGACASRPGLAWSNILGRRLNMPIVNLGFSGNGQLEQPVIALINEIDAKLFVLDCMPNLTNGYQFTRADVVQRITNSVKSLQLRHPRTPILLVEHSGGLAGTDMDTAQLHLYKAASELLAETFAHMQKAGVKNIYLLSDRAIGFDDESTVDGTHPNDIGMMKYAAAYERIIKEILQIR